MEEVVPKDDDGHAGVKTVNFTLPKCWIGCMLLFVEEDDVDEIKKRAIVQLCGCKFKLNTVRRFNPFLEEPVKVEIFSNIHDNWVDIEGSTKTLEDLGLDMVQLRFVFEEGSLPEDLE